MTMRADWIWTQYKRLPPFTWLGKLDWEYLDIEDAGQSDNGSGDYDRITPDAAGEQVDDAVTVALPAYQRSWHYYEVRDLVYSLNVYRDWLRGNGFAETLMDFRHTLTNEMHAIFDTENPLVRS